MRTSVLIHEVLNCRLREIGHHSRLVLFAPHLDESLANISLLLIRNPAMEEVLVILVLLVDICVYPLSYLRNGLDLDLLLHHDTLSLEEVLLDLLPQLLVLCHQITSLLSA